MAYDVIIVGASFAGLATAACIRGRVLLIDRKPIGTGQTSACATLVRVLEEVNAQEAILQVHPSWTLHIGNHARNFSLTYPFCTISYERFCQSLFQQSASDFLLARALGFEEGQVITTKGRFTAPFIVDASGWRAVLANSCRPGLVRESDLIIGIETEVPFTDSGLHFWLLPGHSGYFWHFPCQETTRFGVVSYQSGGNLKAQLEAFMRDRFRLSMGTIHGGRIPTRLRRPVVDQIFVVGDAAGQCYGLTAEGIRPTIRLGRLCGELIQRCLDGAISREDALREYERRVYEHRRGFQIMRALQKMFPYIPLSLIDRIAALFAEK